VDADPIDALVGGAEVAVVAVLVLAAAVRDLHVLAGSLDALIVGALVAVVAVFVDFAVGLDKVGLYKVGLDKVGLYKVGLYKVGLDKVGLDKVGLYKVGLYKVGLYKVGLDNVGLDNVGLDKVRHLYIREGDRVRSLIGEGRCVQGCIVRSVTRNDIHIVAAVLAPVGAILASTRAKRDDQGRDDRRTELAHFPLLVCHLTNNDKHEFFLDAKPLRREDPRRHR